MSVSAPAFSRNEDRRAEKRNRYILLNERNQPVRDAHRRNAGRCLESRGIMGRFISKGKSSLSTPE
jgi:hypothetical protein